MRAVRIVVVLCLLTLVSCPPIRDDGGGGGDGGSIAFRNGALVYFAEDDAYEYHWAMMVFRAEGTVTCEEYEDLDYSVTDLEGDWIGVYLYRGLDMPWEQTYFALYDYENDCGAGDGDYSDLRCNSVVTSEHGGLYDSVVVVSSWDEGRVRGTLTSSALEEEFDVDNCGPWSYDYGDDDDWDDDDSGGRSDERDEGGGGWRLRIR